jgi:hypothetical protein
MSFLVDASDIERIVGVPRDRHLHYARAVSAEQTVYILHSQECLDAGKDLRLCRYSAALDRGIDLEKWIEDRVWVVEVDDGRLVPVHK